MVFPTSDFNRASAKSKLSSSGFDVLVVGGGITGAGVALDASSRGLHTALVEARDFAWGTSSRSSKLVHGGLRYLSQHRLGLVHEGLVERRRLLSNATHLVRPLPFLIPLFSEDSMRASATAKAYSAALWAYDAAGGWRIGHRHHRVTTSRALSEMPTLDSSKVTASFLYWDAQVDDARLTLNVVRTAVLDFGAVALNYAPVASLTHSARDGRVTGAILDDGTEIAAKVVVDATGVWAGKLGTSKSGFGKSRHPVAIRPAKGVHLAVPSERLSTHAAIVLPVPEDRRSIFVVPWQHSSPGDIGGFTYIGTTDTDYDGPLQDPQCEPQDIDYLLNAVNRWTNASLTTSDVTGMWAGLRPLVASSSSTKTSDLSRKHLVVTSSDGVVTVTGGKLTTYRAMAAETVDQVQRLLGKHLTYSRTRRLPLWGYLQPAEVKASTADAEEHPLDAHLHSRYGSESGALRSIISSDPSLAEQLVEGLPYVRAEAVFAARYEMAHTLEDVLSRRTRSAIFHRQATASAAPAVAKLLAGELGWDSTEEHRQLASFLDGLGQGFD